MSQADTPMKTVFDMQRTAVEQSHEAVSQLFETGKRTNQTYLDAMKTAVAATDGSADVAKTAVDAYFDALEATVPAAEGMDDLRETVHEQVDAGAELQGETLEAVTELAEGNAETAEQFADSYEAAVDDSFDEFLAAHEQFESRTLDAAEAVEVPLNE
jgi:hypothetical protein